MQGCLMHSLIDWYDYWMLLKSAQRTIIKNVQFFFVFLCDWLVFFNIIFNLHRENTEMLIKFASQKAICDKNYSVH